MNSGIPLEDDSDARIAVGLSDLTDVSFPSNHFTIYVLYNSSTDMSCSR